MTDCVNLELADLEPLADVPLSHNNILTRVSALSSCTYGIEGVWVGVHPIDSG